MENSINITQKLKNRTTLWSSQLISTFGDLSEKNKNTSSKQYRHLYVHCSIINNNQEMETA